MSNPIRRRRLGVKPPFTAPDPGNLIGWWEADFGTFTDTGLTTPTSTDGATVAGWKNKVAGGVSATNATAPVLKLGVFGSQPALLFASASSQALVMDALASSVTGTDHALSYIAVVKLAATGVAMDLCGFGASSSSVPFSVLAASTTNWFGQRRSDASTSLTITGAATTTAGTFVAQRFDGSLGYLQVNGVDQAPTSLATGATTLNQAAIGCLRRSSLNATFWNGHIAALVIYQSMVTDGQLRPWRDYLGAKYGVPA